MCTQWQDLVFPSWEGGTVTYHHQVGDQALSLWASLLKTGPWRPIPQGPVPLGEKLSLPGAAKEPTKEWGQASHCQIGLSRHLVISTGTCLGMTCEQQTTTGEILPILNPACLRWGFEWVKGWGGICSETCHFLFCLQPRKCSWREEREKAGKGFVTNQSKFLMNHEEEFCWKTSWKHDQRKEKASDIKPSGGERREGMGLLVLHINK